MPLTTVADDDRRDGNWWRKRPRQDRLSYIVGFFDGIKLGNSFTIWSFMDERSEAAREARVRTFESYNTYAKRLARVTNDQVLDGLDTFFGDYQNRSIQIQDGFWVVLCNITGDSKEQIELLIQNLRSSVLIE